MATTSSLGNTTSNTSSSTNIGSTAGIVSSPAKISSLGIGSGGVLSASVISKLEAADRAAMINPIDAKITTDQNKQAAMKQLTTLLSSFQSSADILQSSTIYQTRTVTGTNSDINVTANPGVSVQNFTISNTKLATTNVMQSGSFSSPTDTVASGSGNLNLNIDGSNYKVAYTSSTTYSQLVDSINNAAGSKLAASILQTGTNAYSLVLNSKTTGNAQEISLTDLGGNLNSTLKNDAYLSGGFTSPDSSVATGSGNMTITAAGTNFTIPYTSTTTLTSLASSINQNSALSADVSASVIQDSSGASKLVLTAKKPAEGQTISISDQASGGTLNTNLTTSATSQTGSLTDIQTASNASLLYNGIALSRPTNTITDIIPGVTIDLLGSNASANIGINQDLSSVQTAVGTLVKGYNALQKQLHSMTISNTAAGTTALFSGSYLINSIQNKIASILSSVNSSGQSLVDYGVTFNRDGSLSFDASTFNNEMKKDPSAMISFFSGSTTTNASGGTNTTQGIFNNLYDYLNNLQSANGTVTAVNNELTTQIQSYEKQKTADLALLSSRYSTMTKNFTQYSTMIATLNSQFSSLSYQISAATTGKTTG